MNYYDDGDLVVITGTFTDEDGTPIDPDTVSVQYRFGYEAATTKVYGDDVEVEKTSTGIYTLELDTTGQQGKQCDYRWFSAGNGQAASAGSFFVSRLVTL